MTRHARARSLRSVRYRETPPVSLDACPFCRELFEPGEARECPTCGIRLADVTKLPPSPTLQADLGEPEEALAPEHELLPRTYPGRGRGALVGLSLVGVALFLSPWIDATFPYTVTMTGFDLAHRMGWPWGALVAWVVLLPTVASRRTIAQLRGARVAAAFLSAMPALTGAILLAFPQRGSALVPVRFHFDAALYATVGVALVAIAFSVRLGGRLDEVVVTKGTSAGETLH
jgi:hypothetical protein